MATQYTGGTVSGQILTAATMNSIGAAWETWTPTLGATGGGALGSTTINLARYAQIQKCVFFQFSVSITSVGTASGRLTFTLPLTAQATTATNLAIGSGYEWQATTLQINCYKTSTTVAAIIFGNGNNSVVNGYTMTITGMYEAA
jgi:hypothetical protein